MVDASLTGFFSSEAVLPIFAKTNRKVLIIHKLNMTNTLGNTHDQSLDSLLLTTAPGSLKGYSNPAVECGTSHFLPKLCYVHSS